MFQMFPDDQVRQEAYEQMVCALSVEDYALRPHALNSARGWLLAVIDAAGEDLPEVHKAEHASAEQAIDACHSKASWAVNQAGQQQPFPLAAEHFLATIAGALSVTQLANARTRLERARALWAFAFPAVI